MRYLKATLVALVGAFMLAVAVTTIGGVRCRKLGASVVCHYVVQTGGREMLFALGFAGVFVWFLRGRHRIPGL
jgi:hypothetical protein